MQLFDSTRFEQEKKVATDFQLINRPWNSIIPLVKQLADAGAVMIRMSYGADKLLVEGVEVSGPLWLMQFAQNALIVWRMAADGVESRKRSSSKRNSK